MAVAASSEDPIDQVHDDPVTADRPGLQREDLGGHRRDPHAGADVPIEEGEVTAPGERTALIQARQGRRIRGDERPRTRSVPLVQHLRRTTLPTGTRRGHDTAYRLRNRLGSRLGSQLRSQGQQHTGDSRTDPHRATMAQIRRTPLAQSTAHRPSNLKTVSAPEFRVLGIGDDAVDYRRAWDQQREIHADVVAGGADRVLLLEHPPVFTCGKRTDPHERPADPGGADVIDVDRGGKITFHGPGQLVGYPIVRLPDHVFVVDYVRRLEEALIRACGDLGVTTARVPGRSGVWLQADERRPECKIAAIGIRVSHGVTMHGFALNCDMDLGWYDRFVPCGITDAGVTSLSAELGRDVSVADTLEPVQARLAEFLAWQPYDRTPDYDPRPEPKHERRLSVPVLTPSAPTP